MPIKLRQAQSCDAVKPAIDNADESSLVNPVSDQTASLANDAELVLRCISGEVKAWEELYQKCHDPLCTAIRVHLGPMARDPHLVDEIAARTWYAVIEKDGKKLKKYDSKRGAGILTFLKLLAQDEISRYFVSNQRRIKRELISHSCKYGTSGASGGESMTSALSEFLVTLSPREQDFCREHLMLLDSSNSEASVSTCSAANVRQLTHRIYKKFLSFIGRDQ